MRLANGSGSIVCLDPTGKKRRKPYAVRITSGWKNGKQQRKYLGYYATQQEAIMALAEYHKNGINIDISSLTLGEVCDLWFKRMELKQLSESSMLNHKSSIQKLDELKKKPIKDIKTIQLQRWVDNLDLKPRTKKKVLSTIHQVFEYAVVNDMITKNYVKGVEVVEKAEKTGAVFTDAEIKTLWEHKDEGDTWMILVLLYTGMRIGELIDMHKDSIFIQEGYMVGGNKTKAGKGRIIPLHHKIIPFIAEKIKDNNWLMPSARGGSKTNYPAVRREFKRLMDKFGMEHNIHDTRKTAVSIMHTAGLPLETIQIIVGHSGNSVTEKVYLYKSKEEIIEAINTIEIPY